MNKINVGQVFRLKIAGNGLIIHPDDFCELVLDANSSNDFVWNHVHTFSDDGSHIGMVIHTEPGMTFHYMKCDFLKRKFFYINVTHYQILVSDRLFWQSFKTEEDFFKMWERIK